MKCLEDQLCSFSKNSGLEWDIKPFPISSSVDWKIKEDITELVRQIGDQENKRVIFDYTGGTKPMAVHVYRQILFYFRGADFTYVDPRELALRKDGRSITGADAFTTLLKEQPSGKIKPDERLKLTLKELAQLHGYVSGGRQITLGRDQHARPFRSSTEYPFGIQQHGSAEKGGKTVKSGKQNLRLTRKFRLSRLSRIFLKSAAL